MRLSRYELAFLTKCKIFVAVEEGSYPTGGDDDLTAHCVTTAHIAIPVIFFVTATVGLIANMAVIYLIIILR